MRVSRIFILISAILWGITGLFVDYFGALGFSSLQLVGFRAGLSALIIGVWLFIKNKSLFRVKPKHLPLLFCSGVLSFSLFAYLYYVSMEYNGLAVAAILLYTAPIFVAVLSVFIFKTKLGRYKIIALIVSVLGCVMVTGVFSANTENLSLAGILIGLGSGLGYALYSIFGKLSTDRGYKGETIAFYTFLFSSFITIPLGFSGGFPAKAVNPLILILLIAYAVLTGVLPYVLYTKGLEKTEPPVAALLATAEPMVAAIVGIAVLRQPIDLFAIMGILLIFAALVLCAKN